MTLTKLTEELAKEVPQKQITGITKQSHNRAYDAYSLEVEANNRKATLNFQILKYAPTSDLHNFEVSVKDPSSAYVTDLLAFSKAVVGKFGGEALLMDQFYLEDLAMSNPLVHESLHTHEVKSHSGVPVTAVYLK
jgi:hypothetical protein